MNLAVASLGSSNTQSRSPGRISVGSISRECGLLEAGEIFRNSVQREKATVSIWSSSSLSRKVWANTFLLTTLPARLQDDTASAGEVGNFASLSCPARSDTPR